MEKAQIKTKMTSSGIKEALENPYQDLFNGGKHKVTTIEIGKLKP